MTRLKIQTLRDAGLSLDAIATHVGASKRTVQRVAKEAAIADPSTVDAKRDLGRPSKVTSYLPMIRDWLKAEPRLKGTAILARLEEVDYDGGKSAVYAAIRRLRPEIPKDHVSRFEAVAGEFSQHDFGQVVVRYTDGSTERVHFFVSCMKFSRMRRVFLADNERTETICHALVDAFVYFGGLPLLSVFDNPKTIVRERQKHQVKFNETFEAFCAESGVMPMATWPRRPQEKGAVENQVGYVKSSFFKALTFRDRLDLEQKLEAWHERVNDKQKSRATGETPRERHLLELSRLRPLKVDPKGYRLRYTRTVRTDGFCEFDGRRYFVGVRHVGTQATLLVSRDDVAIYRAGAFVAQHPRALIHGKCSVLPEQRSELLEKDGARSYVKRQLLLDLCPAAEYYMTEIRHRRPEHWEDQVASIYELLEIWGAERMREAFTVAAQRGVIGAEYLEAVARGDIAEEACNG